MSLPTTSLPTVVFLDRATIPRHIPLPALPFEHHWLEYDACEPQQVVERLLAADIVITNKVVLTREMLVQLPKLKLIAISARAPTTSICRRVEISISRYVMFKAMPRALSLSMLSP